MRISLFIQDLPHCEQVLSALGLGVWGCRMVPTASLQRNKISHPKGFPGYDTKRYDSEALFLELSGKWSILSLPLLPGPLSPEVTVPVRVLFKGEMELYNHLIYLKPFNCVQVKLVGLDSNI